MPNAIPPVLTHACVRCGRPVALEVALCEECNPLGLAQPAASQAHGTVFLGIVAFVVFLAVVARLSLAGVGPFDARLVNVVREGAGLRVTLEVANRGSAAGVTTCGLVDPARRYDGPTVRITTPKIEAGASTTIERSVTGFGDVPLILDVACASP